ncbi:phosphoinositide 3-kinase regulatory subunit 5-like [Heteronotia binoei]|uniref:phosphoinositide 3-kinase regulatory subunit 5-like n=1 Tax=Heteronotia binoei TaxID=13085 RepID=UPI002930618C|nr:phosphoinositide 3-kinase regulatory subunit 5-like [Heteronotia binoei]
MQHTTCTEDRIHHALERCLHGLSKNTISASTWTAGLCLNCWSLQELVSRDAGNYLILLEKILQKAEEVQENCDYDLFIPLALLFSSAVLYTSHFPSNSDLLWRARQTFRDFLAWPVPYCDFCQELLTFIDNELKAPGISYQRLVRAEHGLSVKSSDSSIVTVLLLNSSEVHREFVSVAERLSAVEHSHHMLLVTLLEHIYQANFGTNWDLVRLHQALKLKPAQELMELLANTTEAQESAAETSSDPTAARKQLESALQDIAKAAQLPGFVGEAQTHKPHLIPVPAARCYAYVWDQDNFDILNEVLDKECDYPKPALLEDEEEETDGCFPQNGSLLPSLESIYKKPIYSGLPEDGSCDSQVSVSAVSEDLNSELSLASTKSLKSFVSSLKDCMDSGYAEDSDESSLESTGQSDPKEDKAPPRQRHRLTKIYKLFKTKSQLILGKELRDISEVASLSLPLRRAESLCNPAVKHHVFTRSRRAQSLPQHVLSSALLQQCVPDNVCVQRRPFLSCDEDMKVSTLRVVVFGSDRIVGKVARAYSNLKSQERSCPWLTRYFKLQFFYVPIKRSGPTSSTPTCSPPPPGDPQSRSGSADPGLTRKESSTNSISQYIGLLDPWYERNVLGLMNLPADVLCQQCIKPEGLLEEAEEQLPILADMILYYCRFATHPVLLQIYQIELTFAGGETRTEIFIHSLEMGHSAVTRAIKASALPAQRREGWRQARSVASLQLPPPPQHPLYGRRARLQRPRPPTGACRPGRECEPLTGCRPLSPPWLPGERRAGPGGGRALLSARWAMGAVPSCRGGRRSESGGAPCSAALRGAGVGGLP